jgi:uncharacterized membrane protein HdeD (DUF308 family)
MIQTVGALAIGAGVVCLVGAIWAPQAWWQLAVTGLLLIVAGGTAANMKDKP